MQTFLPYPNFVRSLACLDYRRLGKQRVEAAQLIKTMDLIKTQGSSEGIGWANHPATKMWTGYEGYLKLYYNLACQLWMNRKFKQNMPLYFIIHYGKKPPWLGNKAFHLSHQSNLLRKNFEFYKQYNWSVSPNLDYIWPSDL